MHAQPAAAPGQPRVLVAFATRAGSTRELAEAIGSTLRDEGYRVDLQAVADAADVDAYAMVVLGSALYFQRLMPEMLDFIARNTPALAARPVALFSVGAEMRKGTPAARAAADTWVRRSLSELPSFQPVAIEHFAGAVELQRLSFWWRLLVLATFGERGDWRNPVAARAWIAALMTELGLKASQRATE